MKPISDEDKLVCLEREIGMRKWVYAGRVRQGHMSPAMAERELAIMQAIAADYRAKVRPELKLMEQGA